MATRDPALQATTSGAVPRDGALQLQHAEPKEQVLFARLPHAVEGWADEVAVGLFLGNLFASAVYGVRGEHRG